MTILFETLVATTRSARAFLSVNAIAILALALWLPMVVDAQPPTCAQLELSTAPFTKGVALAAPDALPAQRLAQKQLLVYARRTAGPGCQPAAAYLGNNNPIVLGITFNYDVPNTGTRNFAVNNNFPVHPNVQFLGFPGGSYQEIELSAADGISGPFVMQYSDAGQVDLAFVDAADLTATANHQISWVPASFQIEEIFVTGQPGIQPSVASEVFSVIASARSQFNLLLPNFGPDVPGGPAGDGEQLILRSNLQAPTFANGGRNGRVANNPETGGILVNGTQWRPLLDANGKRTGELLGENFQFNEVGKIQLSVGLAPQLNELVQGSPALNNALPVAAQYFGGIDVPVTVAVDGANMPIDLRFIPASFGASNGVAATDVQVNVPQFNTGCPLPAPLADAAGVLQGGYTYAGDWLTYLPGSQPTILVTPLAADGLPVKNYIGSSMRLSQQSLKARTYQAAVGNIQQLGLTNNAGTPADPADDFAEDMIITPNQDGTVLIQAMLTQNVGASADRRLLRFTRDPALPLAPFDADLSLTVPIVDDDGVTTSDNLPVIFGAATPGNGIAFSADDMTVAAAYTGRQIRHGQLKLGNGAGGTTADENMPTTFVKFPLSVEYFTGNRFEPNVWDNCTQIVKAAAQIEQANGQGGNPNFLPQNQFATPNEALAVAPMVSGDAMLLYFSGLAGIAQITYNFAAVPAPSPLHLVPADVNIRGQLSFGIYAGDTRIAYRSFHSRGVN